MPEDYIYTSRYFMILLCPRQYGRLFFFLMLLKIAMGEEL